MTQKEIAEEFALEAQLNREEGKPVVYTDEDGNEFTQDDLDAAEVKADLENNGD